MTFCFLHLCCSYLILSNFYMQLRDVVFFFFCISFYLHFVCPQWRTQHMCLLALACNFDKEIKREGERGRDTHRQTEKQSEKDEININKRKRTVESYPSLKTASSATCSIGKLDIASVTSKIKSSIRRSSQSYNSQF